MITLNNNGEIWTIDWIFIWSIFHFINVVNVIELWNGVIALDMCLCCLVVCMCMFQSYISLTINLLHSLRVSSNWSRNICIVLLMETIFNEYLRKYRPTARKLASSLAKGFRSTSLPINSGVDRKPSEDGKTN